MTCEQCIACNCVLEHGCLCGAMPNRASDMRKELEQLRTERVLARDECARALGRLLEAQEELEQLRKEPMHPAHIYRDRVVELEAENARLREWNREQAAENDDLSNAAHEVRAENARLRADVDACILCTEAEPNCHGDYPYCKFPSGEMADLRAENARLREGCRRGSCADMCYGCALWHGECAAACHGAFEARETRKAEECEHGNVTFPDSDYVCVGCLTGKGKCST